MSPTVFRAGGYRFFFFSREEDRMHVHVGSGDGEAKFWLIPDIELAKNYHYSRKQLKEVENLMRSILMRSLVHGNSTSGAEITHISPHGVWILSSAGKELFMPYDVFPWFKDQPVKVIHNVEEQSPGHFYWPDIDIDLSENIIENPSHYPRQSSPDKQRQSDT